MSCENIPSLLDLQKVKKHADDFGRLMGTGEGDSINEVTGQVRPTYNKVMKNVGFKPGSGDFTTGFTVMPGQRDYAWFDPVSKNWYSWLGTIPTSGYVVTPGTNPVGDANWKPVTDQLLRSDLAAVDGASLIGGSLYSDIRTYLGPKTRISCLGRAAIGDHAGGMFIRDDSDFTTVDNGGTVLVDALGRRWKRDFSGAVNARWFVDGDATTDATLGIISADTVAADAGAILHFPQGVYRCTNGIDRRAQWSGDFAPQLAPFPLVGDDKQYLRPGYKHLIPGSVLLFTGAGTATATTQRTDDFSSFTYCVKDAKVGMSMSGVGIVLDCDVYDAAGNLTAFGADNSASYDVGHYIDDAAQCLRVDVTIFGYFPLAGTALHSVVGADDPDYNIFRGGSTMGRYGLALIGSDSDDGFDSGLSGTMSYGMDIFTLDHHSRSNATAPAIYANADTWALVYIDGHTDATQTDLNGHYFFGGSIRTYAIHPIHLDRASQTNFIGCIFESSNFASAPNAATKQWKATANTQDVGITNCRFATDVGLFAPAFGGVMKGQLTVVNCPGLASGGGIFVSEANGGIAHWMKLGGASGGSGDPAVQFGSGSALSSTSGWSIRKDIDAADVLDVRWNGASINTLYTGGGFGKSGYAAGPTRTIAAGVITISTHSYYRVANEGAAATDDLDTINGGSFDGQILILAAASAAQDVVLKDGTGNLRLTADFTLTHSQDRVMLQWDGATWNELSRADNTV